MNARAPLKIIGMENCWENVHPDVVFVPQGFAGYQYWMAFTPYPLMNDRYENPTIRASHDGVNWERVDETPDPLVAPPDDPEFHHADPELIYHSGNLHVVFATIHRETDEVTFSVISCKDDLRWSRPEVVQKDVRAVSPSFQIVGDVFHEWFIRVDGSDSNRSALLHRHGSDLMSLGDECECQADIPGYVAWHVDVLKVEDGYESLITAFPYGRDPTACTRLFHLKSKDGFNFRLTSNDPIIYPSSFGWDDRMIYRSSFLKIADGSYRIWYSAVSWGCHSGIGLLEGTLDSLNHTVSYPQSLAPVPSYVKRLPGELEGRLRYELRRHLPSRLLSRLPTAFFMHGQR